MRSPVIPLNARKGRLSNEVSGNPVLNVHRGVSTLGSPIVDTIASTANITVGDKVFFEFGFTGLQTVLSKTGTTITVANNAAGSAGPLAMALQKAIKGPVDGQSVRLYTNNINPTVTTVLGDLVEATFDGYAAIVLAMTFGYVDPSSTPYTQSQLLDWTMTGSVTPETVYGYWVDDGTDVLMVALFDAPIGMVGIGSVLSGVLEDSFPPKAGFIQVTP